MKMSSLSLVSGLLLMATHALATTVTSDFSIDADGWTAVTTSDVNGRPNFGALIQSSIVPQYHAAGGELAGYISITDPDDGWTYFSAPTKFLGDQSENLGGTLVFSLTQTLNTGSVIAPLPPVVALQSGSTVLVLDLGAVPTESPDWRSYAARLDAGFWRIDTADGDTATAEQFAGVLANLTRLYIAGEFITPMVEINGLDSVSMGQFPAPVPLPATFWFLAPALCALGLIRRSTALKAVI